MKASSEQQAMELNELIKAVIPYIDSSEARSVLTTAFQIAADAHKGFQRISGESYVNHAMAVASILAEWHAPLTVVTVGLLHDIRNPDYSHRYSLDDVRSRLGADIFQLLEAVVSLNGFMRDIERDFDTAAEASDTQYHVLSLLREDCNAIVVKIADRLHNLWTISALNRYFQERTARIGLSLLAPLADRLGMGAIKRQLEDVCFEILYPPNYNMLKQHYTDASIDQEVKGILEELQRVSSSLTVKSEVRWQSASLYTFYLHQIEQNTRQGKSIHAELPPLRMVDAGAFVILTNDEIDCYRVLGTLHKLYQPIERQFRDFIGHPEENGYRALHTQVKHLSGHPLYLMIRTHTTDLIAERGITARWWSASEEFLPQLPEDTKSVEEDIQVLTPNGKVVYFPPGATVLDFAYYIHTDVGHQCVGALVNGERADLSRILRTGDRIEIISGGPGARPSLDWLDLVRTPRAISRIRQWLTQHRRNQMLELGHALLDKELKPLGLDSADAQVYQLLAKLASKENLAGTEDLLVSIGVGRHKAPHLVEQLKSMRLKSIRSLNYVKPTSGIIVLSAEEALLPHMLAQCCKPTPPEDIVGYRRTDNILAIHKRDCSQIKEREKLLQVAWDSTQMESNYVVVVEALNRPGLASDLSTAITLLGFDMPGFSASRRADGVMAEAHIYLGKTTSTQRGRIQKALESVPNVTKAEIIPSSFLLTAMQQAESSKPIYQPNPYGPTIAAGARFYGREIESQRISALLHDQSQNTAILLWGQKRIGKTSFVLRLEEQSREDFLPIYVDVQGLRDGSTTQFLHQLMMAISRALKDNTQDAGERASVPALNRLRKDPLSYFDTFMMLAQEAARSHPLIVILDEFQCLCSLREEGVSRGAIFSRLRSHAQHGYGIHFILSGGGLLNQLTGQCDIASLFNIAHYEKLGCLEARAARRLIRDGLTRVGNITENAVELLLDFTAGHPFYLQLLCSMLYDQAQENKTIITSDAASLSTREWLGRADASRFQHLWEGHNITSAQRNKLILSAIAQFGVNNHEVEYDRLAGVICSIVPEQDLVRSLADLADLGVLEHNHANYAIKVELFARWLRQHWPLELTLKEAQWL